MTTGQKEQFKKQQKQQEIFIGSKIADKVTSKKSKELKSKELPQNETSNEMPKKDVYLEKKDNKLLMN